MILPVTHDATSCLDWGWEDYQPFTQALLDISLEQANLTEWLRGWSDIAELITDVYSRLYVASTANTADPLSEKRYQTFISDVYPQAIQAENQIKQKLINTGLIPEGFEIPLRNMRAEADLFREANLPLLSAELQISAEYNKITGGQSIQWEGKEITPTQLRPVYLEADRSRREKAWRLSFSRQLADRTQINDIWKRSLALRCQMAANAGKPDYRAYRWQELLRFDYTPEDCLAFHEAIAEVAVPAASRIYAKKSARLGVDKLRPWDLEVDPFHRSPLKPYQQVDQLIAGCLAIFTQVDPDLGAYFKRMVDENLLDLENRINKAPGGYCNTFPRSRVPFIFSNAVGLHDDVQTVLHEGGHAFHAFEAANLAYYQQMNPPMEFCEVASMGMELLSSPYLAANQGGFYSPTDAARARIEHLENSILFWPYMAVVDAFQHWAYTHPVDAAQPDNCDQFWAGLWTRFMPGVDWTGLEEEMVTGWQRKLHIFEVPFYYVEYGLAQLGAVQVWSNALNDPVAAVKAYRKALALGGTQPLPTLYQVAGAQLAFDAATLQRAVDLMESVILELEVSSNS